MIRLTWAQPEDLVAHALAAKRLDGYDVGALAERWAAAGGNLDAPHSGATAEPATPAQRALARRLLTELDALPAPAALLDDEPDDVEVIAALAPGGFSAPLSADVADRVHGGWLGRAVGCLLGKPVEKIPREGIRAIAESTGNWPLRTYFTAAGLDPDVAASYPWNRASRTTSLVENISGMPEDDDLNYALLALILAERHGDALTTDDVALAWLELLPAKRTFTAERIAYRNLLDGYEPDEAGAVGNPFQDWIGAQIRTDVYGWICPGDPARAAGLAWQDGRLSHRRSGLYGAMFVAAASSAAVTAATIEDCVAAGLSVIPPRSRYASAVRRGVELAGSALDGETAVDTLYAEFGHLHWVHSLNNSALVAFALARSGGDFVTAITTSVAGGWDTDSTGATVGSICGALAGFAALPQHWIDPLNNRLATTIAGFDGIGFDELASRTVSCVLRPSGPMSAAPRLAPRRAQLRDA
jgi:ADP-ribosylglycohydrolase